MLFLLLPFLKSTFLPSGAFCRAARSGQGRVLCGAANPWRRGPLGHHSARREGGPTCAMHLSDPTLFPQSLFRATTVATLPFALSMSVSFARCKLGVLVSAGAATWFSTSGSISTMEVGPGD